MIKNILLFIMLVIDWAGKENTQRIWFINIRNIEEMWYCRFIDCTACGLNRILFFYDCSIKWRGQLIEPRAEGIRAGKTRVNYDLIHFIEKTEFDIIRQRLIGTTFPMHLWDWNTKGSLKRNWKNLQALFSCTCCIRSFLENGNINICSCQLKNK